MKHEAHSDKIIDPQGGSNQTRVRAYNERLVLSLIRRHGSLPKSEIARRTGLSAQTASVIMRSLEADGLLLRGEPKRGKVGQPSVPMTLNPAGVYSFGLKIGRRSADLFLVDFLGKPLKTLRTQYAYPTPDAVLQFAKQGVQQLLILLDDTQQNRVAGIGVAMPFELWNWAEKIDAPSTQMQAWATLDFAEVLQGACGLPVFLQNDATAACSAELVFGRGSELTDFIYLFIGTFIGGGVVLNHTVYSGRTGNAGALGPMPVMQKNGQASSLIDHASLLVLEKQIQQTQPTFSVTTLTEAECDELGELLQAWIQETAHHLAIAVVSACSVIDFEAAIVDGDFPPALKQQVVAAMQAEIQALDLRGLEVPMLFPGKVGRDARALGAASLPLFSKYLLDQSVLFS